MPYSRYPGSVYNTRNKWNQYSSPSNSGYKRKYTPAKGRASYSKRARTTTRTVRRTPSYAGTRYYAGRRLLTSTRPLQSNNPDFRRSVRDVIGMSSGLQVAQNVRSYLYTNSGTSTGGCLLMEHLHMDNFYIQLNNTMGGLGVVPNDITKLVGWSSMKCLMTNMSNANIFYRVYYFRFRKDMSEGTNPAVTEQNVVGYMTQWLNNGGSTAPVNQAWNIADVDVTDESRMLFDMKRGPWIELKAGRAAWINQSRNHYKRKLEGQSTLQGYSALWAMKDWSYGHVIQAVGQPSTFVSAAGPPPTYQACEPPISISCYVQRRCSWYAAPGNNPNYYFDNIANSYVNGSTHTYNDATQQVIVTN